MKKLMLFALVLVVLGVIIPAGAVPTVPPIPSLTPTPETPAPSPGGGGPAIELQRKFQVISLTEQIMEGYAGSSIEYSLRVIQKGYPELVVHLEAEVPDKWKASFSKNDFNLLSEESVELELSLFPPEDISAEKHEITIRAVGKAKEDTAEAEDSLILTAMTYLIDVGVTNLQVQPAQPKIGEFVNVTAIAVNYTQRDISDITVEFLVNSSLASRQSLSLSPGISQPLTFGWTAQSGTFTLVIKVTAEGDTNRRNDVISQRITLGDGIGQIDALYDQAKALFAQGDYSRAQDLFSSAFMQYTEIGETAKASEVSQFQELCNSYLQAQTLMMQGDQAFSAGDYEQAAANFQQARDIYAQVGDTQNQTFAQQRFDEAVEAQKPGILLYIGISVVMVVVVASAAMLISRRRSRPVRRAERPPPTSRFRLEEPTARAVPPAESAIAREAPAVREAPPAREAPPELIQFHQKTEDALSRFNKAYIRDNLQQAMRVYLSLEGEKKQLPRGKDMELERIINTNLRELEQRIFGTF
jgi:tetratricopeptide (TPR) repeat protein